MGKEGKTWERIRGVSVLRNKRCVRGLGGFETKNSWSVSALVFVAIAWRVLVEEFGNGKALSGSRRKSGTKML